MKQEDDEFALQAQLLEPPPPRKVYFDETLGEWELSRHLLRLANADQRMRLEGPPDPELDKRLASELREIVGRYGWPTVAKVGNQAAIAAFLIVQHADHDAVFQKECLTLMKSEETDPSTAANLAYLEDRVRVNSGLSTLYGTQFWENPRGEYGPRPIEDPANLNARRASVGLEPFEEYEKVMRELRRLKVTAA